MKFDKVKNKKAKSKRNKWWIIKTKNYTIPLYLLPIALVVIPFYKINDFFEKQVKWSNKKANKVLDKWLLKVLEWDEDTKEYSRSINAIGNWFSYKSMPFGYRKWAWKFSRSLKTYLLEEYENPNYVKTVEKDYDWYEIIFKEKA